MKKILIGLLAFGSISAFALPQNPNTGTFKITTDASSDVYVLGKITSTAMSRIATLTIISNDIYLSCKGEFGHQQKKDEAKHMTVFLGCADGNSFQLQIQDSAKLKDLKGGETVNVKGRLLKFPVDHSKNYEWENFEITKQ